MPLLDIASLNARYDELEVLHGISLTVEQGEVVTLVGANGAGKSTLLRCISGLVQFTGRIEFEGVSLAGMPAHLVPSRGIAHVPEGRHTFGDLTVIENLRMGHLAAAGRVERQSQLGYVLELFPKLAERRKQLAGTLSGGEQQMLAIGRALMSAPRLLLLDEPSLGLAPIVVDHIFELIAALSRQGITILLIEQNAFRALDVATRGYIIESGRIGLEGATETLKNNPDVHRLYLGG